MLSGKPGMNLSAFRVQVWTCSPDVGEFGSGGGLALQPVAYEDVFHCACWELLTLSRFGVLNDTSMIKEGSSNLLLDELASVMSIIASVDRQIREVCRTLLAEALIKILTDIFPVHIQNILTCILGSTSHHVHAHFFLVALQPNFGSWPPPLNFPFHFSY
jgi:hypothetical protein